MDTKINSDTVNGEVVKLGELLLLKDEEIEKLKNEIISLKECLVKKHSNKKKKNQEISLAEDIISEKTENSISEKNSIDQKIKDFLTLDTERYFTRLSKFIEEIVEEYGEISEQMLLSFGFQKFQPHQFRLLYDFGQINWDTNRMIFFNKTTREKESHEIFSINKFVNCLTQKKTLEIVKGGFFSSLKQATYMLNKNGKIETVRLETLSGDITLNDLILVRQENKSPYTLKEIEGFIAQVLPGLLILQNLRIYHSDITPLSIIFSKAKNQFLISEFNGSKSIPIPENKKGFQENYDPDEVRIGPYANYGTKNYNSPEKNKLLDFKGVCNNYDETFNPFKCDMWSFGKVLEEIISISNPDEAKIINDAPVIKEILEGLLQEDWHKRFDAFELFRVFQRHSFKITSDTERNYIDIHEKKIMEKEGLKHLYDLYGRSELFEDQLKFIDVEYKQVMGKLNNLDMKNILNVIDVLKRKGNTQRKLGNLKGALETMKEIHKLDIDEESIPISYHLAFSRIHKDFGNISEAYNELKKSKGKKAYVEYFDTIRVIFENAKFWIKLGQYEVAKDAFENCNKEFNFQTKLKIYSDIENKNIDWQCLKCYNQTKYLFLISDGVYHCLECDYDICNFCSDKRMIDSLETFNFSLCFEKMRLASQINEKIDYNLNFQNLLNMLKEMHNTEYHAEYGKTYYFYAIKIFNMENDAVSLSHIEKAIDINSCLYEKGHLILKNCLYWKKFLKLSTDEKTGEIIKWVADYDFHKIKEISSKQNVNELSQAVKIAVGGKETNNLGTFSKMNAKTMTEIIEKKIPENMEIPIDLCAKNLLFDEFNEKKFQKIDLLGKGSFGEVWRALDKQTREYVALKYVYIKKDNKEEIEKSRDNFIGLLKEAKILERLKSLKTKYFCEYKGISYQKDEENLVSAFVLITTAGDCSVLNLKERREIMQQNAESDPYTVNEALKILYDMTQALSFLKKLNIYHSDIKPANIVYNKMLNNYQLIDFGVSQTVSLDSNGKCMLEEYGLAGTNDYNSPEKSKFIEIYLRSIDIDEKFNEIIDPNHSDALALQAEKEYFDEMIKNSYFEPFKCDIYSLGKTISDLMSEKGKKNLEQLEDMMTSDLDIRIGVEELESYFSQNKSKTDYEKFNPNEKIYLELIEYERKKNYLKEYYKNYEEAYMPAELLEVVEIELKEFEKYISDMKEEDYEEDRAEIKFRKGLALRKNGNLTDAEIELNEVFDIQTKLAEKYNKPDIQKQKSDTLLALAAIINERGDHEMTENKLRDALEIRKSIYISENHHEILAIVEELATHKGRIGKNGEAAEEMEAILQTLIDQFSKEGDLSTYAAIAKVLFSLCKQWTLLYQYSRATNHLKFVVEMRKKIYFTEMHPEVAAVYEELAINHSRLKDFDTAINYLDRSLTIRKSIFLDDNNPQIAYIYYEKGKQESYLKMYELAIQNIKKAYEIWLFVFKSEANSNVFSAKLWLEYLKEVSQANKET